VTTKNRSLHKTTKLMDIDKFQEICVNRDNTITRKYCSTGKKSSLEDKHHKLGRNVQI